MIWGGNNQQQMNPMKKIELVIFDMAGTTVRDDDTVNICLREALAAGQVTVTTSGPAISGLGGDAGPALPLAGDARMNVNIALWR